LFFTNGYKKLIINDYTLRFVCLSQTITILTLWLGHYDHFSCNEHLDVAILSIVSVFGPMPLVVDAKQLATCRTFLNVARGKLFKESFYVYFSCYQTWKVTHLPRDHFPCIMLNLRMDTLGLKKDKSSTFIGCEQKLDLTNSLKHQLQMGMQSVHQVLGRSWKLLKLGF